MKIYIYIYISIFTCTSLSIHLFPFLSHLLIPNIFPAKVAVSWNASRLHQCSFQESKFKVPTIYKAYICKGCVRAHTPKIWPKNMVQMYNTFM